MSNNNKDLTGLMAKHRAKFIAQQPHSRAALMKLPKWVERAVPGFEPLVFVVDDDLQQSQQTCQILQQAGYSVRLFTSLQVFGEAMKAGDTPSAIVLDMVFPDGDMAGAEYIKSLQQECGGALPPVLFLSVRQDLDARLAAYRSGSGYYLNKPVEPAHLIRQLDELTLRMHKEPYRVLMVDDDELVLEAQAIMLRTAGLQVSTLSNPRLLLEQIDHVSPDVLVIDFHMPDISGSELAALLREDERYHQLPIVFLSAELDENWQLNALYQGGDDFLVKPVDPDFLSRRIVARARRSRDFRASYVKVQQLLYEREREHLALNQHAIVSIADHAGNITYINDLFCEISGYSPHELLGNNHRLLKSGKHPDSYYQEMWAVIASGQVWSGELCNRRKDGSFYWVKSTITPFLDDQGRPYQYASIRTDITHEKAIEQALAKSVERLDATLESTKDGILAVDDQGKVLFMNVEFRRMWNLPEAIAASASDEQFLDYVQCHLKDPRVFREKVRSLYVSDSESDDLLELVDGRIFERHSKPLQHGGKLSGRVWSFHDITKRCRAEQMAEAAKERLRLGQMYANIGTWEWDIVSGELFWTEQIAPLFGYPAGDLDTSYENFLGAVHPEDRQAVIDAVSASIDRDAPYDIEHRVLWPDGTERWLLERGAVIRDADGKPLRMLGVVQDVDTRKRIELALAEREQQLLNAQSLASLGNWHACLISSRLVWSDEVYRIFGYEPGSINPSVEVFHAAVHPEDRELVKKSEEAAHTTGYHDVIHRILRPDGSIRIVHELAKAEYNDQGVMIGLIGTVQDVTERTQVEETLKIFKHMVDAVLDGVLLIDAKGIIQLVNPAVCAIFGYEYEQLIGSNVSTLMPEPIRSNHDSYLEIYSSGDPSPIINRQVQVAGLKADNTEFPLEVAVSEIYVGNQLHFVGLLRDITERKHVEEALVTARETSERANQAKSEFLSSMSHELRTPMNSILGFAQILEYDDALEAEQQDSVQEILKAGNHLLRLINEVLDLAKVESGQLSFSLEPLDLCLLVEETLSLIQPLALKREIHIQHSVEQHQRVFADRTRLKQVLLNLLSNAVKYNRHGGNVNLSVEFLAQDRLRLLISDTGNGIPRDRLTELFEPFNRLDAEGSEVEGTGIGLTISRRIMELMGGSISAESEVGVGSRFCLELPLKCDDYRETLLEKDLEKAPEQCITQKTVQQFTMLYIEDNPANLKLVTQILAKLSDVQLISTHLPELGIELAQAHKPDLILLDINMPGMDGYQVLQVLKQISELKKVPVLAVTANAMPRDIERGLNAGFSDFITKPIQVRDFIKRIERWLGEDRIASS